ncbi:aromatic di-alanine and TPR containing protein [Rhizoctonia solani 123E]|uniref:Aromatic di-alanine and TPR containing protein n=1 Tax=Rhizoctonia solani 123E TaxID=1423351 RepID=A0A074RI46_9AGAM|nr:aromatic di-alanine and TPR containing protein [Rhizoctonia solani 123E]
MLFCSSRDGHPELSIQLANLGTSYSYRFQRLSELIDLDKAIEYRSRALALTPEGHSRLSVWLANLGTSYSHRFQHLGGLDDLEKAIRYRTRALALTHDRHPNLPIWLANLAVSHNSRYERRGGLGDLEKAIEYDSRAVSLTPEGHPDMSGRLANLGTSHRYRFLRLDELGDLEKAIEYSSQAVTLTSDDDPQLPSRLINLGMAYRSLYERLRRLDDLDKAIEHSSYALALTPEGHPGLPAQYFQQALSYLCYYEHTGGAAHLQDALRSFRLASRSSAGAPKDRFQYARLWAKHASEHGLLNCIEAYQTTIDLLPQFVWLGTTSTQRYEDLSRTADLAVEAASAAISSSNYALALEWLEHTRCVVWNQYLMLRSPLDRLQSSHPALAARLYKVAHQLHSASSESRESRALSFDSMVEEQVAREHRRLATEYDKLLTQARSLPDFEDFLRPMRSNGLVRAARNGPIVVINCHRNCCDALIISPQQDFISHLPLPNFTRKKAQDAYSKIEQLLRHRGLRERGIRLLQEAGPEPEDEFRTVLAMLWNDVVKPVLEFLGYMNNVSAESLPHIIWCPTGAASFLPLHAAGDYSQPHSRIFNYAISSYTPTLTALLASTPTSLRCDSQVLAIGQEATPGCTPLPGTAMEIERVKFHTNDKVGYSQLLGSQATTTAVLGAMERHDWVHLACHAHQDINDPTKSGFFLHDGILDLNTINQRSFKNKGLAFLSACQTATGDDRLPDEAVHLASGMLMAGYSSVIATMWSVADIDSPFVADRVYGQLIKEGKLGSGEAGKALHNAVAELREQIGEKEFERWVPYIHIGS